MSPFIYSFPAYLQEEKAVPVQTRLEETPRGSESSDLGTVELYTRMGKVIPRSVSPHCKITCFRTPPPILPQTAVVQRGLELSIRQNLEDARLESFWIAIDEYFTIVVRQ